MSEQLQLRRGTISQVAAFTGAQGELAVDTTNNILHVNDGATAGGWPLALATRAAVSDAPYSALVTDRIVAYTALTAARVVTLPAAGAYPVGAILAVIDESRAASANQDHHVESGRLRHHRRRDLGGHLRRQRCVRPSKATAPTHGRSSTRGLPARRAHRSPTPPIPRWRPTASSPTPRSPRRASSPCRRRRPIRPALCWSSSMKAGACSPVEDDRRDGGRLGHDQRRGVGGHRLGLRLADPRKQRRRGVDDRRRLRPGLFRGGLRARFGRQSQRARRYPGGDPSALRRHHALSRGHRLRRERLDLADHGQARRVHRRQPGRRRNRGAVRPLVDHHVGCEHDRQ